MTLNQIAMVWVIQVLALATFGFCAGVIYGYIAKVPEIYTWPEGATAMSLPTAICECCVCTCIFLLSRIVRKECDC